MPRAARPHVLIIGSGFGGLFAAKRLRRTDVHVTVVAATAHHLLQPLLHRAATGILSEGDIAPATREILRHQRNTTVLLGEATRIDLAARTVTAATQIREPARRSLPGGFRRIDPRTARVILLDAADAVLGSFAPALPGRPEVHLVGDMIARPDVPGVAQAAIQAGRHAAQDIRDQVRGRGPRGAFTYRDKGDMATISRFFAVAEIGRIRTTGFLAWLLWLAVHLVHVVGFKSRVTTLLHWTVSFLGRARSERTATAQQVFARQALLRQGGPGHDEMPRGGPGPRAGTGPAHG